MKNEQYYRNIANGIARINQCIFACRLAPVETGSIFSKRFNKDNLFNRTIIIPDGIENMYNGNPEYFQYPNNDPLPEFNPQQEYVFSLKLDNLDQETIDSLKELSKPDDFIHGIDDCGSLFSAN